MSQEAMPGKTRSRLPKLVDRAISVAVTPDDGPEQIRTKRLFVAAMWASLLTGSVSTFQLFAIGTPLAASSVAVTVLAAVISLIAIWVNPRTFPGVMHLIAAATIVVSGSQVVMFGGFIASGANAVWGVCAVLGAVAIFGDHRATFWLVAFVLTTTAVVWWAGRVEPIYTHPNPEYFAIFNLVVVLVFIYVVLYYYVRKSATLFSQSERLLRNILPDEIADRLKVSDEMIAEDFSEASILFADVADFTPMSEALEPAQLIMLLNEVFTSFDTMVEERGLEKIKTIGDAYMVAAGVPVSRPDHALALCDLALAMDEHIRKTPFQGHELALRIGISSGPVVAGIIGRRKFSYDLWGDTVNTASRMESSGVPGRIQLTEATFRLVQDGYECERRGVIEVKGKGQMEVWFLQGRRRSLVATQGDEPLVEPEIGGQR